MERDPWCRESFDILKVKYQLGAALRMPNDSTAFLTILSTAGEGHASETAIQAFRRLAPHIEQACALGHVMERQAATQAVLLDALANKVDGVILLGRSGAPTFMNDPARRILAAGDGLAFSAGAFVTRRGPETRNLQRMIADAIAVSSQSGERPGGRMLLTRPSGLQPYVLHVMPAPPTERFLAGQSIACVIHLHDLAAVRLPSRASLSAVFGLTEREADLAVELVRSASLMHAASNASMAVNTARNHLQSIFRKCGASNQAEAVQLLSRVL
jgi:DNA-binding CsgD family transcriptional regulator